VTYKEKSPESWANDITRILNDVYKNDENRFPVNVKNVALEISKQKFPNDPITLIEGNSFDRFEGMLKPREGKNEWGIFYNNNMPKGRINFTIAHEFGHYLLHRKLLLKGIECDYGAMKDWNSPETKRETDANTFAAYLLMPFDDFRKQTKNKKETIALFKNLSERYGTSLISTILRWIEQTEKRAVIIESIDGYIDWSWSSKNAKNSRIYFSARNPNQDPIELPKESAAYSNSESLEGITQKNIWFNETCVEINIPYEHNNNLTLLIFDDVVEEIEDAVYTDVYDEIMKKHF
jgi:hypothetical protein